MLACCKAASLTALWNNGVELTLRFAIKGWFTPGTCAEVLKRNIYTTAETIQGLQTQESWLQLTSRPPLWSRCDSAKGFGSQTAALADVWLQQGGCSDLPLRTFWCVPSLGFLGSSKRIVCWLCFFSPRSRAALHYPWPQSDITCWPTLVLFFSL